MPRAGERFPKPVIATPPAAPEEPFLYWSTTDKTTAKVFKGDVLDVLRSLPSRAVQVVVTSPPYW